MVKLIMIDSSYFELGQQNGGQKLNRDWNSLSKFQYNYLITKQSAKLNNKYRKRPCISRIRR